MPLINTTEVIDRNSRPQVQSRVMLRSFFLNDGQYQDPYAISSVHVFKRNENLSPSTVLDTSTELVASGSTSAAAMVFAPSANGVIGEDTSFNESNYKGNVFASPPSLAPCSGASGVYKLGTGEFAVVLNGISGSSLSGIDQNGNPINNTASQATRYIDVWTVKLTEGSDWKTYINEVELFDNTFMSITEPLLLRAKNTLANRQVINGSKVDLKIGTEITVENRNIDSSVKNIFKSALITDASIQVQKVNDDPNLPGRYDVVDTTVDYVTSDNTLIYSFDTSSTLQSGDGLPTFEFDKLGGKRGTYAVRVYYTMVSEKIVSPWMYFIVK